MLKSIFNLIKNTISKDLIVSKVFLKKVLKHLSYYQIFSFEATFLLMLLLNHCFVKKLNSKEDLIESISSCSFEVVLTLLIKTVAI